MPRKEMPVSSLTELQSPFPAFQKIFKKEKQRDFPGGPVAKTLHFQCGEPGEGTRSHMPQLRNGPAKQINKCFLKRKERKKIDQQGPETKRSITTVKKKKKVWYETYLLASGYVILPGVGHSNPLQYSCLENPMERGAWQATVHGVARVGHDLETKSPQDN